MQIEYCHINLANLSKVRICQLQSVFICATRVVANQLKVKTSHLCKSLCKKHSTGFLWRNDCNLSPPTCMMHGGRAGSTRIKHIYFLFWVNLDADHYTLVYVEIYRFLFPNIIMHSQGSNMFVEIYRFLTSAHHYEIIGLYCLWKFTGVSPLHVIMHSVMVVTHVPVHQHMN